MIFLIYNLMQIYERLFYLGTYNFIMMGSINDVCYFVLVIFVMMRSTSNVLFLCLMFLLYCILLLDKNYRYVCIT